MQGQRQNFRPEYWSELEGKARLGHLLCALRKTEPADHHTSCCQDKHTAVQSA